MSAVYCIIVLLNFCIIQPKPSHKPDLGNILEHRNDKLIQFSESIVIASNIRKYNFEIKKASDKAVYHLNYLLHV